MFNFLRGRLGGKSAKLARRVPPGTRVYAIGDVHGCLSQLESLLKRIALECGATASRSHLIFLGDLIDRGPDSAGVVRLLHSRQLPGDTHSFLMGNHEEALLQAWNGDEDVISGWLRYGGIETLDSYGISRADAFRLGANLAKRMREVIPEEHIRFIAGFRDYVVEGDYLFVHAGIRPGIPLQEQESADLRWIRAEFLEDQNIDHGYCVVHGHTITPEPEIRRNRIGIDTGCYSSGRLTALVLEADRRRFITSGT